jgi:hypothetical protein
VETSTLTWSIAHDQLLCQRIEAIVRDHRWTGEDDPTAPVPVDQLAWAAASNPTIREGVANRLEKDAPNVAEACADIPDADLTYVVLTVAMPRLTPGTGG